MNSKIKNTDIFIKNNDFDESFQVSRKIVKSYKIIIKNHIAETRFPERNKWFNENRDFIISAIQNIKVPYLFSNDFYKNCFDLIQSKQFFGADEEIDAFVSDISLKSKISEKFIYQIKDSLLTVCFICFSQSIYEELEDVERYVTVFRNILNSDFSQFAGKYSYIEKVLKSDPQNIYQNMTKQSRKTCVDILKYEAKKKRISPEKLVEIKLARAKEKNISIVETINRSKNNYLYFPIIFIITLGFSLYFYLTFKVILPTVYLIIPIYFFSKKLTDFFFSLCVKSFPLYQMQVKRIDKENKTSVAITSVISDKEEIKELFKKLSVLKINNKTDDDYISFGIICDLKNSQKSVDTSDEQLKKDLIYEFEKLNGESEDFFLFLRKRKYSKTENSYFGRERKRGAIEDFLSFVKNKNVNSEYEFFGRDTIVKDSKFLITLDSDTEMNIGQVKRLVGTMIHPMNRAKLEYKNGKLKVISGFGIIQPAVNPSLNTRITTRFEKLHSNGSGENLYSSASFNNYQTLFNKGLFCGKGIIDIDIFCKMTKNAFKSETILSHDIPEGALCRTGLHTSEHFSDSFPKTPFSDYKRMHRWIRGDIQNLRVVSKLSGIYKYVIIENFLNYLKPYFEFSFILMCGLMGREIGICACLIVVFLHFVDVFITVTGLLITKNFNNFGRHFSKKMRNTVLNSIYLSLISICAIGFESYYYLDAIIRSIYRMVFSKKHLLQWNVFKTNDTDNITFFAPSLIFSSISIFFVKNLLELGIILSFVFYPFLCYFISKEYPEKIEYSESDKEKLKEYAKTQFNYFNKFCNESTNYLPPDNVQFEPYEKIAMRTSPTNIGFYLISLILCCDMKIIKPAFMIERIEKAIISVSRLEKYKGHLFNWYDIISLKTIGDRFISTVDSGNFIASLIVVYEGLKDYYYVDEKVKSLNENIREMINSADFSVLFDKKKNLFYVGIDPEEKISKTHYDLYMSESRITSFLAIAKNDVDFTHWKQLSRPIVSFNGRVGAVSWSGTAFEYFLPMQFFGIVENSFEDETLDFALYCQKKDSIYITNKNSVFGKSESGYYSFDSDMNYQYKAFGNYYLSIQNDNISKKVISPYSSFLMLGANDKNIYKNIEILAKNGLYSSFGFYESVDFNSKFLGDYKIVKSVMAHHSGMIIMSVANLLMDNLVSKRFMNYENFYSKKELLCERFPIETKVIPIKREVKEFETNFKFSPKIYSKESISDKGFLITDGESSFVFLNNGNCDFSITGKTVFSSFLNGLSLNISTDKFNFDLKKNNDYKIIHLRNEIRIDTFYKKMSLRISFFLLPKNNSLAVRISISGYTGKVSVKLNFMPVLMDIKEYLSHPEFQNLQTEIIGTKKEFHIRKRNDTLNHDYLNVYSTKELRIFSGENEADISEYLPIIDKELSLQSEFDVSGSDRFCYILKCDNSPCSFSDSEFLDGNLKLSKKHRKNIEETLTRLESSSLYSKSAAILEKKILSAIFNKGKIYLRNNNFDYTAENLWKYGISGDCPIISIYVNENSDLNLIQDLISVSKKLSILKIKADIVFIHKTNEGYFTPVYDSLRGIIEKFGNDIILNKNFGVHIINTDSKDEIRFLQSVSLIDFADNKDEILAECAEIYENTNLLPDNENVGQFIKKGFSIDKTQITAKNDLYYIISEPYFGTVLCQNNLGFSWYRNSNDGKLSSRINKEKIVVYYNDKYYDLLSYCKKISYKEFFAIYEGEFLNSHFKIIVMLFNPTASKCIFTEFSENFESAKLIFMFSNPKISDNFFITKNENCNIITDSVKSPVFSGRYFLNNEETAVKKINDYASFIFNLKKQNNFYFGAFTSKKQLNYIIKKLSNLDFKKIVSFNKLRFDEIFNKNTDDEEYLFLYQSYISRMTAKTGPFQIGGAYGFRDQLQDIISLIDFDKSIAKTHILRASSHQFLSGDVLHWWHPQKIIAENLSEKGLKSKCSDDYLWLIYSTYEYIEKTGDREILKIKTPFLKNVNIENSQTERFDSYFQEGCGTLYEHLEKCAELFIERGLGKHSLPPILRNDWNDGLNKIGGESLWLGEFGVICLERFIKLSDNEKLKSKCETFINELLYGIKSGFNDNFFARGYDNYGNAVGADTSFSNEMSIDIIVQAFAVFLYLESDKSRDFISFQNIRTALLSAYNVLFDKENRIVKLFSKPFENTLPTPGYIQKYAKGVRENGGQYTHASVWLILAFILLGERFDDKELISKGIEMFEAISPERYNSISEFKKYGREPYVLCGDVFDAYKNKGRGGWSWYTGSASWYHELVKIMKKYRSE